MLAPHAGAHTERDSLANRVDLVTASTDGIERAVRNIRVMLPYADVCENNELRTYCISIKPLSMSGR
jgi:hypothetical protein